jgi:hypothetical protein
VSPLKVVSPLKDEDDVVANDSRVLIDILPDPDACMPEDRAVRRVAAEEMLLSPGDDRERKQPVAGRGLEQRID